MSLGESRDDPVFGQHQFDFPQVLGAISFCFPPAGVPDDTAHRNRVSHLSIGLLRLHFVRPGFDHLVGLVDHLHDVDRATIENTMGRFGQIVLAVR